MRYAIYFLPQCKTPLWAFGSAILGYDAIAGAECAYPVLPEASDLDLHDLTCEARPYGFHATLKAPFRLANHAEESKLLDAAAVLAQTEKPVEIGPLAVSRIGSFLALTAQSSNRLQAFAARCVSFLDGFRAPLTSGERDKRLRAPLTARQRTLLDEWGYPYVFDEFRFHLTLTSSLPAGILDRLQPAMDAAHKMIASPVTIDSICVCVQPDGERFRLLKRFRLERPARPPVR